MPEVTEIASGLEFPEGPVAMSDGSVVLVEIKRRTLTRVGPEGKVEVVAELGGGPNGAAIGPDGKCYVANNGGCFTWEDVRGLTLPVGPCPDTYAGGRIQRVDLDTGEAEDLYTECDGRPLRAPNDLVFDRSGGFWFTDHGTTGERSRDRTGLFYAKADGSAIDEVVFPLDAPNGVGLSPDGSVVYVAETHTGRVRRFRLSGPGQTVDTGGRLNRATLLAGLPGMALLDSLAVDLVGNVCVATIGEPGITVVAPDGAVVDKVATDDPLTTNVCFGGPDRRTAYVTLSGTGRLVSMPWPRPGLQLAYSR